MRNSSRRAARFARAWLLGPKDIAEDEILVERGPLCVPATLYRPLGTARALPWWVALHGMTRAGRGHEALVRFARATAYAGVGVAIPEIPEWRDLELEPELAATTVASTIRALRGAGVARDEPMGVIGFSFGAPHAVVTGGSDLLCGEVAGVAGFGGYASLDRTFLFMMTGQHEWQGVRQILRPDPYGRWIVGANYLTRVPGLEDAGDVAAALRGMAVRAGDARLPSWHPTYDADIDRLRGTVAPERQALFDLFAPRSDAANGSRGVPPPLDAPALADALSSAARHATPSLDPREGLAKVRCPVHLIHGRADDLIPYTETLRLRDALPLADPHVTITRLFGHSAQDRFRLASTASEVPPFGRAVRDLLGMV